MAGGQSRNGDADCALPSRVCMCGHFHPSMISACISTGWGLGWGQGPWVRAKTIRSDRDRGRLCEKVFMRVCARRRQGSLAGGF